MIESRDCFGRKPLDYNNSGNENCLFSLNIDSAAKLFSAFPTYESYKIYTTHTNGILYDILLSQAMNLSKGLYKNRQGESSSTMVGAKGIGKTTSLKTFTNICKFIVPNVYVLYISFINIMSHEWLREKSLTAVIILILEELGVSISLLEAEKHFSLHEYLISFLLTKKMKLMLLVDELDQLYRSQMDVRLKTLYDLAFIGNQPSGTLSTIICGSSSTLELLITGNARPIIRSEFPLLDMGAPNLNETKFLTKRVYSPVPTDLTSVAVVAGLELDENTIYWIRIVAFAAGCSARAVRRVVFDSSFSEQILANPSPDSTLFGSKTLNYTNMNLLRDRIIHKFYDNNAHLFNSILYSSDIVTAIATINWESQFKPLKCIEVEKLWKGLISDGKVPKENAVDLVEHLLILSDRCWVTIGGIESSKPQNIFPYSMLQCFKEKIKVDALPGFMNQLVGQIRNGAAEIGKTLSNSSVCLPRRQQTGTLRLLWKGFAAAALCNVRLKTIL